MVLLVDHRGTLDLVADSAESARTLELSQLWHHEGPRKDCFRSGQAVECADLAAAGQRWPVFTVPLPMPGSPPYRRCRCGCATP